MQDEKNNDKEIELKDKKWKKLFIILTAIGIGGAIIIYWIAGLLNSLPKTHIVPYKFIQESFQEKVFSFKEDKFYFNIQSRKIIIVKPDEQLVAICPDDKAFVETREIAENSGYVIIGQQSVESGFFNFFWILLPLMLLLSFFFQFFLKRTRDGEQNIMLRAETRGRGFDFIKTNITFADVIGVDEAKAELEEIVDFLKNPEKAFKIGAKIPKGILLVGAPGTGKTLLARAVAGEACVPFCHISGSDFMEMFIGVGASRVRDIFKKGKNCAPAILFIDEIDSIGAKRRAAAVSYGHDEQGQTLNALLAEMDGFDDQRSLIVIGATNRPESLDRALLRPGRFDRQAVLYKPDIKGRLGILQSHVKNVVLCPEVDLKVIAKSTPNFSGADLANLVNEAALYAARNNKEMVSQSDFEYAKDKIIFGGREIKRVMDLKEKRLIAIHEAGHAFAARYSEYADPVHKITIIPRGLSLGATMTLPEYDRFTLSEKQAKDELKVLLGGRAAELIIAETKSSGAANDLARAAALVHKMVCEWGMCEELPPMQFGRFVREEFLDYSDSVQDYSEKVAEIIDCEKHELIKEALECAKKIVQEHLEGVLKLIEILMEKETVEGEELKEILEI